MSKILKIILAVSLFLPFPVLADVPAYKLVNEKSSLKFIAINNGAPVEGQFKKFSADIKFDPSKMDESKIIVEVETGSVFANYEEVAKNLLTKDWLATADFPKAVFTSKTISRMPNSDNYYVDGTLELRGKTMPATMNFQLQLADDKNAVATGYVTIKRSDYGVGQGDWAKDDVVKNEVRVEFRVVAEKQ